MEGRSRMYRAQESIAVSAVVVLHLKGYALKKYRHYIVKDCAGDLIAFLLSFSKCQYWPAGAPAHPVSRSPEDSADPNRVAWYDFRTPVLDSVKQGNLFHLLRRRSSSKTDSCSSEQDKFFHRSSV